MKGKRRRVRGEWALTAIDEGHAAAYLIGSNVSVEFEKRNRSTNEPCLLITLFE